MLISDAVKALLQNDKELCKSAINVLLKISNNIINHPRDQKFRRINLSSDVTEKILLPAIGALEILFLMGFEEGNDSLILSADASLDTVTSYRDQLEQLRSENIPETTSPNETTRPSYQKKKNKCALTDWELANYITSESEMEANLKLQFQQVLIFESPRLQEEARNTIPYQILSKKAKDKEAILMKDKSTKNPLDFQDCILVELLAWFKEFFSWFDQGFCEPCQKPMKLLGQVVPTEQEKEFGGHRVENFQCEVCGIGVRFPRYFHPGKLLQTKKGRCMEWASCFTLMCRSLGLDARYIWDKTDHVWTEVFSVSQNRWIQADPCENKVDCPLMYESGWKKQLSYVFGFSKDEVVDCVWRYSADHKGVCDRRKSAREDWLAATLLSMNKERQASFPEAKRRFLEQRLVREIVEFFSEPKVSREGESEGRLSGSLAWRVVRGETSTDSSDELASYVFSLTDEEIENKEMLVKYSSSQDIYLRVNAKGQDLRGWRSGVYAAKNVFRKHEKDWKVVYLSRAEGSDEGELKWRFDWSSKQVQVKSLLVVLQHKTLEDGVVQWQICNDGSCFMGNQLGVIELNKEELGEDCSYVEVRASLSKGKGDEAWQHAQLFRQKEQDKEFPFFVKISFS